MSSLLTRTKCQHPWRTNILSLFKQFPTFWGDDFPKTNFSEFVKKNLTLIHSLDKLSHCFVGKPDCENFHKLKRRKCLAGLFCWHRHLLRSVSHNFAQKYIDFSLKGNISLTLVIWFIVCWREAGNWWRLLSSGGETSFRLMDEKFHR